MAMTPQSYYEILGVARDATADDIHRAYRRLARRYHPDVNAEADARSRFDEVSTAYEVLHDPARRSSYDRSRAGAQRTGRPPPRRSPAFTPQRPRRDVPYFLDDELNPITAPARAGLRLVLVWDLPRPPRLFISR
jgi:curved DNA-binding protein CbpA